MLFLFIRTMLLFLKHFFIDNKCYPTIFLNYSTNANVKVTFWYFCGISHVMGSATLTLCSGSKLMMNFALATSSGSSVLSMIASSKVSEKLQIYQWLLWNQSFIMLLLFLSMLSLKQHCLTISKPGIFLYLHPHWRVTLWGCLMFSRSIIFFFVWSLSCLGSHLLWPFNFFRIVKNKYIFFSIGFAQGVLFS